MNSTQVNAAIVAMLLLAASGASAQGPTLQQNPVAFVDTLQIINGTITYPGSRGVAPGSCGGVRTQSVTFAFSQPFASTPSFTAAISQFDIENTANARLGVNVATVNATGATVDVYTWCDTNLWQVNVSFMALGPRTF
jgi:hypothetical protein